ncbi:2-oxo-4-hydroxy-4-carboxy-5-ureidoimidazoline decarboxylase [Ureibacillus chungkukjangi]|uniref:2-oxo-4-hydroxy-4-carboxy-5-ureidoimidazoline decarboxylase n=1 Tax=Ureibacillus chungkukjangi TaxID=1202712 RepID=UPI0038501D5C
MTNEKINVYSNEEFVEVFGEIFEHSPWIAQKAVAKRPFNTFEEAFEIMRAIVAEASYDQQLTLILEHPELGKRIKMSEASVREQNGAGLDSLSPEEFEDFSVTNKAYMAKFEFPFIIAVAGKDKNDILHAMKERLNNSRETEFETALREIYKIARLRFNAILANMTSN